MRSKPITHTSKLLIYYLLMINNLFQAMGFRTISTVFIVLTIKLLCNIVDGNERYNLHVMPDSDVLNSMDKTAKNAYCQRCMMSESDWFSCFKCFQSEQTVKRAQVSFINYAKSKNCNCCQRLTFNLLCCLNCEQKWQ